MATVDIPVPDVVAVEVTNDAIVLELSDGQGDAPLDPGRPARGRHDPTWRVIENLHDG